MIQHPVRLAIVCAASLTTVLGFSIWAAEVTDTQVSGWIEALATLAALASAIIAATYAAGAFRLESRREERWTDTQRSAQAALVAGWFGTHVMPAARHRPGLIEREGAWIRNASDLPVTGLVFELWLIVDNLNSDGSSSEEREEIARQQVDVVPPASEPQFFPMNHHSESAMRRARNKPGQDTQANVRVSLRFRDSAGGYWRRTIDGDLSEK